MDPVTRVILLDIEGTIGSISYVHDVLFPYASARLEAFVREADVAGLLADTRALAGEPEADLDRAVAILQSWIAEDRKATPLKALQGLIWEEGFRSGALRAHLYPDAAAAIRRWAQTHTVAIYSSGSVHAQRLYVRYSDAGDLSGCVKAHFDTTTGPKRDSASYLAIAAALGHASGDVVFLSDVVAELDAAAAAGFRTILVDRDRPATAGTHRSVADFDGLTP